jgi:hypothetical protein
MGELVKMQETDEISGGKCPGIRVTRHLKPFIIL